ncbi:signal peptidase II, partial [Clostridium paraputrificum]|nr:signal peptidase II [Clostridium paraputrificum]
MKNLKYLTISILPLMWSVYFLFEILTGRVKDLPTIIGNIALIILFALVGFYFYKLSQKYPQGFKCKTIIIIFSILMVIDQGIKL